MAGPESRTPSAAPDGIGASHSERRRGLHPHASILSLVILGAILAAGLSGYVGGRRHHAAAHNAAGEFALDMPAISRTGDVLQTRISVAAAQRIGKLVIAVEPSLWRDITTNSTVPDPADQTFDDGFLRFGFDGVDAGKAFEFRVAQQINPSLFGRNRGRIVFLDGRRELAVFELTLTVLP